MFNLKTDYALNKKNSAAIVYIDAEGGITRLTREDFASLEEFLKWKAWSDANYHITEKANHVHADHTLSLYGLSEAVAATPSPEVLVENRQADFERRHLCRLLNRAMQNCLSPAQQRRLWKHYVLGMSMRQIAKSESVSHQKVSKSIAGARKKVRKFFEKWGAKAPFLPR